MEQLEHTSWLATPTPSIYSLETLDEIYGTKEYFSTEHIVQRPFTSETAQSDRSGSDDEKQLGNFQSYYLKGWRLQLLSFAMCLGLFLASLESTIVSTSLLSITNDLNGFQKGSWVVAAYLLTYTGFLVVMAKLSDTFGRKATFIFCLSFFIVFSLGCGFAQTMTQLIVFRAFQGIGGGGISTLTFVILPENISPADYPTYAAIVSSTLAFSSLLGPVLGGIICSHTTWRWIFYLNAPAGTIALILIVITLPGKPKTGDSKLQTLKKVDWLGAILVLSTVVLFVTALEQGGTGYSWKSTLVLSLLSISVFLGTASLIWSRYLQRSSLPQEPILAWDLLTDRFSMGLFLNTFFLGSVFLTSIVVLPQQSQVVFGDNPAKAGYRLLCVTLVSPLFTGVAGFCMQKKQVPPLYILICAQSLSLLGCGLASSVTTQARSYPGAEYVYQAIMGAGFGLGLSTAIMAAPLAFSKKDMAVGIGTTNQMRGLGSSIGISIAMNLLSHTLTSQLEGRLSGTDFKSLLGSAEAIKFIPAALQDQVRQAFAEAFRHQMQALCGLAGAGLLATLIMVERRPRYQERETK